MAREKLPVTPAVRILRARGVEYTDHPYAYEKRGGAKSAARELGLQEHAVVKTLVMEDEGGNPLLVLMHGDREVSTKRLARHVGTRSVRPVTPEVATKLTGYLVGGISPLGTRKALPVYIERTILDLPRIYPNGGRRGYLIGLRPRDLAEVLGAEPVEVAI